MAIYDYLPKYNYIEPNNLKGLQPGFVVAQMPIAESAKATLVKNNKFVENGTLCDISVEGVIAATADSKNIFIVYNEPLNTMFNADAFYATNIEEECVRLVQLIPGDEWMSTAEIPSELEGRIKEVTATTGLGKSDDFFKCTTMANGDEGHHYVFLG